MNLIWNDVTSYRRDELKTTPRTYSVGIGGYLRLVVTREHIYYPGEWIMHLHPLFDCQPLNLPLIADTAVVQERAVQIARDALNICLKGLQ